jgi:hypothetical protein
MRHRARTIDGGQSGPYKINLAPGDVTRIAANIAFIEDHVKWCDANQRPHVAEDGMIAHWRWQLENCPRTAVVEA